MKKILSIILIALMGIGVASVLVWLLGPSVNGPDASVGMMLWVAYIFLGLAVLAVVGLAAMNIGKSRNNSKIGLFVYGGLILAAILLYFLAASSKAVVGADGTVFDNVFELKSTDMMLYLAYLALGLTVVFLLVGEVRKAIK